MVRSMTGYGTGSTDWEGGRVSVSVRTVNHRFLDMAIRLPPVLRPVEARMKQVIKGQLSRGRVEVSVDQTSDSRAAVGRLNLPAAEGLAGLVRELSAAGLVEGEPLRAVDFLRFPEVVQAASEGENTSWEEDRSKALLECLGTAIAGVVASRAVEGRGIQKDLDGIVNDLARCCEAIRGRLTELMDTLPSRYAERLKAILENSGIDSSQLGMDTGRIVQEAGILAERVDVSEEVERLSVHLAAVRAVFETQGHGPCGKRLDFLAQELLREFNTVASKCRDSTLAGHIVDAKVLCERFREQVQNVE